MAKRALPVLVLLGVVAVVLIVRGADGDGHRLRAAFTSALQVREGQKVQIAGRQIGSIRSAKLVDGRAVVEMEIDDEHWPIRRGTTARLRFGSPLGYALRYVELAPGPASAPALPDGGLLTDSETTTPVEFDALPRMFGPNTRKNLSRLLKNAGKALDGTGEDLGELLDRGGPGLQGVADFTSDLATDPYALKVLIASGASASAQVARNEARLGPLLRDASLTLDALVQRSTELGRLLEDAPGAFRQGRRTLTHLNRTSGKLERLSRELAPGAKGLRALAPAAVKATNQLADTSPLLATMLRTGSSTAPSLTRFLDQGADDLPATGKGLTGLAEIIGCLRPYAPELAGTLSTSQGVYGSYDANGHYIRTVVSAYAYVIPSPFDPAQLTSQFPRLKYAMPRAPGLNVRQPWFQPQCGITAAGMDASQDLEP